MTLDSVGRQWRGSSLGEPLTFTPPLKGTEWSRGVHSLSSPILLLKALKVYSSQLTVF
jgi:hypothetical protein